MHSSKNCPHVKRAEELQAKVDDLNEIIDEIYDSIDTIREQQVDQLMAEIYANMNDA